MTAADGAAGPPSPWNIANALTLLRIALVPVFAVLLMHDDGQDPAWRLASWGAFTVAVITDRVDGDIARRRGLVTDFGKLADPIADKALVGTALVLLSLLGELPWWVTVVILVREVGVTVLRFLVLRHRVVPASRGGKIKTMLQVTAIGAYLLPLADWFGAWTEGPVWWLMLVATAVTVLTGVDYVVTALRRRSIRRSAAAAAAEPVEPVEPVEVAIVRLARQRRLTVATAESLTAGMVSARIADVPGASVVLRGGVVAYSSDLKVALLDVPAALLADRGAVDPDVAVAMAAGVRRRLGTDLGVSTTGVAGPDSQDGKPPGTVFVAVSTATGERVSALTLDGDRPAVRSASAAAALDLLLGVLTGDDPVSMGGDAVEHHGVSTG